MRSNLIIEHFTYTGDGADNRLVSLPLSLASKKPQLILLKGGANIACLKTSLMKNNETAFLSSAAAHFTGGVKEIYHGGIRLGTDAKSNANGTVYYGIAIWGDESQNYFRVGKYRGTGGDARDFTDGGLYFTPDFVATFANTTQDKVWRTSAMAGDTSQYFSATAAQADKIQSLIENGFQLGTSAQANGSGTIYDFFALKALDGVISVGTYGGNGVDGRVVTGAGFPPNIALVKKSEATGRAALFRTSDVTGDNTLFADATAAGSNRIQELEDDGFEVGADNSINAAGANYHWLALKAGSFSVPITRAVL